ncbi:MAG TPA: cation:proton antiporter [Candidatus Poseidoniales archaeon]|nr:MAG: cation:proton antiporter [Euryarchaeota archaeon]HIA89905.1 cation:proton antiporter [Candidatus Poseidoniales archaeon]PXY75149.1 MAG: cation:proton antiporter [Euryarchaeota archaeon]PXY77348.1 MAG: cation:proton antiporter [Euryarchaeota archaeon]HIB59010.1 cation:proton antiporter [Candidatus Poseidoniales archaeon]
MGVAGIETFDFQPLMLVLLVAFLVPIVIKRSNKVAIPIVVGEILAGMVLGPSGLGWVELDGEVILFLRDFGLAYLMFIAGMEIDFNMISKIARDSSNKEGSSILQNPIVIGPISFFLTLVMSAFFALALLKVGIITSGWMMVALILSTTSLGVVLPVLKERNLNNTKLGQTILLTALLADFVTMFLISIYATYFDNGSLSIEMLLIFGLFIAFAFLYRTGLILGRIPRINKLLDDLSHSTAQIKLRASLVLLVAFIVLAEILNSEMILGAFIAGIIVSLVTTSQDRRVERELEAFGFSFFIPIFFVLVGVGFNLGELMKSTEAMLLVPILLLIAFAVKFIPTLIFRFAFSWRETLAAGSLLSARLSLIIAASLIALERGIVTDSTNSAIILVAVISVTISPLLFTAIIRKPKYALTTSEIGEMTLKKLLSAIDHLDISFTRGELKALFSRFDTDAGGMIDVEEFIAAFEGDHSAEELEPL